MIRPRTFRSEPARPGIDFSGTLRLMLMLLSGTAFTGTAILDTDAAESPVKKIILVFKTHFDIGYTDLAANVVQRYRTTMFRIRTDGRL